jgi:hypothetical protein
MIALILGAGFSKWAANLPIASELFDLAIEPFGIREERRLERVRMLKSSWDCANPVGLAEQFIAAALAGNDIGSKQDVLWYVVRRLSEPYIWQEWHAGRLRRHVLMIDENRRLDRPGVRKVADFVALCRSQLTGVVTLNYDLLVEYALGSHGFHYGQPGEVLQGRGPYPVSEWRNPTRLTGEIPFAKLHGSLSWDANLKYTDGRRGLSGSALIVAPSPEKRMPAELQEQWTLSARILGQAQRLLVFGFGFNEYDQAVLTHFADAGRNVREVAIVDVHDRATGAMRLWPRAHTSLYQPPPEGLVEIQAWLNSQGA